MTAACPSSGGLVRGLIDSVDCNIRVLVHESYRDLVGPGTTFATIFTAMLTIYIALIGYQMLLGRGGVRLTVLPVIALKIGVIMAFLTSWAAYQTVIFSALFDGPREVLGAMLAPMGFGGDIYDAVETTYSALSGAAGVYGQQADPAGNILQGGPMLGAGLLWLSAIGVLLITIGVILAAKIVLGFLLALGPVFIALFLFDATRGLFDGWLRATLAFAIMPLAANVFGAAMLIMMSPFIGALTENAAGDVFDMGPIVTVGLIVIVFAVVMAMTMRAAATIAGGFGTRTRRHEETARNVFLETRPMSPEAVAANAAAGQAGADRVSAGAPRTEIVRQAPTFVTDAVGERLGQAYRRVAWPMRGTV